MSDIILRPMQAADIPNIITWGITSPLWQRYGLQPDRMQAQFEVALTGNDLLIVVDDGAAYRACGFAWVLPQGVFGRSAYLRLIGVQEGLTGKGLGAALLAEAEHQIAALGKDLFLLVSDFNTAAQRFYQRQGYHQVGALPGYVLPDVTELIYHKRFQKTL